MKLKSIAALAVSLVIFCLQPAAADNILYAETGPVAIGGNAVLAVWLSLNVKEYEIRLGTDNASANAAVVLSSERIIDSQPFSFEYKKFERGVIFKDTADPIVRIEVQKKDGSISYVTITNVVRRQLNDGWISATIPLFGFPTYTTNAKTIKVAIVAKTGIETVGPFKVEVTKYADFAVRNLRTGYGTDANLYPIDQIQTAVKVNGNDPLIKP